MDTVRASGLAQPPPYSLLAIDRLRDEIDAEAGRMMTLETTLDVAREALQQARDAHADRERARREAREALDLNRDPAAEATIDSALRVRQLESRVAAEEVHLREIQLESERLTQRLNEVRVALLREQIERMAAHSRFSLDDLQAQMLALQQEEFDLGQARDAARAGYAAAEEQLAAARARLGGAGNGAAAQELATLRAGQRRAQVETALLDQRLQQLGLRREAWNRRFRLADGMAARRDLSAWSQDARRQIEQLQREERVALGHLAELRREAWSLRQRLAASGECDGGGGASCVPPNSRPWIEAEIEHLEREADAYERHLTGLEGARHLHSRLLAELEARGEAAPLSERLRGAAEMLRAAWRYEIAAFDDRPITIGKIAIGMLLFAVGWYCAGLASRVLGHRILPRLGLDPGGAAALQAVSFYVLVSVLTLFALQVINIPLTVFTLLGGALAIGIGFGSQNIVNNFISGLILLAERPIKVGDLIDVEGTSGKVEQVGPRSTRVRSSDGIHIIVPNSAFLEKPVVNWTLSDDLVRTKVSAGVVYGSPTDEVKRLLLEAAAEHPKVFTSPEPDVLFAEFGDNALIFELHVWIRIHSQMERRLIESDLRFRIDQLFRAAGITIAFPQRDVHLDAVHPFEVRLVGANGTHAADLAHIPAAIAGVG
jgi:small-conductance mechanosensitive channel